jgi:3-oxoacyl-[acyl-carrier-protein] synthase-3
MQRPFKISGVGTYLPENRVLSASLEKELKLPEGWIERFSGVVSRPVATEETNRSMAVAAIRQALADAGIALSDVGYLISASATYDAPLPNNASTIKAAMPEAAALHFPCVDIDVTCLSFMAGLDYASALVSEDCRHVVVVSSEIATKGLNPAEPESYSLFGDGAAAVVVSHDTTNQHGAIRYALKTYSEGNDFTTIRGGGNDYPFSEVPYDAELHSFRMQGKKLLRAANKRIPEFLNTFFSDQETELIDLVVPHQASKAGLQLFSNLGLFPDSKVVNTLAYTGNSIAASIPYALAESIRTGRLKRGDECLLIGTSAGFSIGAMLLKY